MEGSVLSFLKAQWKVSDTGAVHWVSSLKVQFIQNSGLFMVWFILVFGLFMVWFILVFGLYWFSVYSWFGLYWFSVYSWFGLDRFSLYLCLQHCDFLVAFCDCTFFLNLFSISVLILSHLQIISLRIWHNSYNFHQRQ